jgi:hypothetical protein
LVVKIRERGYEEKILQLTFVVFVSGFAFLIIVSILSGAIAPTAVVMLRKP